MLSNVNNPKLRMVVINRVDVSGDLKKANIFYVSLDPDLRDPGRILEKAKGHLKHSLGKCMKLKYIPELYFIQSYNSDKQKNKI